MLALKGLPPGVKPRIGELAERMQILHHSAVELVNRLERGGFVRRQRGGEDRREVLLTLTAKGESTLRELALHHRAELRSSAPALLKALKRVVHRSKNGQSGVPRSFAKRKNRTRRTAKNTWHRRKKSRAAV
jgi:DNA-binding MarR family transcriptional regulator